MIPDEFNLSGQELQVLSELDSKQYGFLKLSATENAKKRALVAKVMIFRGWEGVLFGEVRVKGMVMGSVFASV